MTELIIAVAGLLAVAAAAALAPRLRIAPPLILVLAGIGVSFLPFVPTVTVDPDWILAGVLPPLLYSASVAMPTMNFRREFTAISGLAVVLVVLSSLAVGALFSLLIPGVGVWWGIALGAIVSPTDAAATSIVKRIGVSGRIVSVLEGESLLNDATALVLLRTAITGTAATISLWSVLGTFVYAVLVAAAFGVAVGYLNLWVRSKITDPTVNTVLSFTVPFLASIPAETLGGSGLVAAVIAGLITGHGAARRLSPQHRMSDNQNWHTVELVLEGTIFLTMGLELSGIVADVHRAHSGIGLALGVAAIALALTLAIRTVYVTALLIGGRKRTRRQERTKPRLDLMVERVGAADRFGAPGTPGRRGTARPQTQQQAKRPVTTAKRIDRFMTRLRRMQNDIDFFLAARLGWREGTVLVWAGMRGAVTLAAAQTLPADAPNRSLMILIAFAVAAVSLMLQGSTLSACVTWVKPASAADHSSPGEHAAMLDLLADVDRRVRADGGPDDARSAKALDLAVIAAQRSAVLDARDDGVFTAETLNASLTNLDADQISLELKGDPHE